MKPTQKQVDYYIAQRAHIFACRLILFSLVGFVTVLLKAGGWIDWSWVWALSPWWTGWTYGVTWFAGMMVYRITVETQEREME